MEQVAHVVDQVRADVLGPRLAEDVVAMTARAGIRLDYAPDSLALIDRIIDGLRHTRPPAGGPVPPALRSFGAYAGEVLHRRAGAEWVDFDAAQREMFGQPFGIRTTDGRVWNPLGKAVKRYQAGTAESLLLFHLAVVGRARG
ncbi:hypothetical protein [Actinacidiphila bryophytorum]|uniref:DUF3806 domain-containing protein n=1 Tax=Actinacidiphila bryophytorum TaxID=1436133 RepID=A0A9W4MI55_9ACTN|nr:hypothetical protein [Actinacidiphila bryophytorum]MBM9436996.1 hypothetical protein [Actinacidiphila bryophytorum]MBN6547432.1 hypothetical protein [Actinacidiphila bryophytorum]CAG7646155.1 conserved hypothetical protein [Actinacidiphila bryophytorum]